MELDATQALPLSDCDDDADEEGQDDKKKPVAYLKIIPYRSCSEAKHPVFEGENVIGRNEESTNIYIPVKALSKQHACIVVRGEHHFIYDKSSRNRSKRGKMYLTPEVRYELKDGDELTLADVKCVYEKIKPSPKKESNNNGTRQTSDAKDYVFEEDSDPSSDLLQPTQAYAEDGSGPKQQKQGEEFFVEDSDGEETVTSNTSKEKEPATSGISVKETPMAPRKAAFVPESDGDESALGQTLVYEEDKDSPMGEKERKQLACMATQAPAHYTSDSDTDADEDKVNADAAPTQVFAEAGDDAPTQVFQGVMAGDEATQVVQQETSEKTNHTGKVAKQTKMYTTSENKKEDEDMIIPDSQAPKEEEDAALHFQATMAFEEDYESDDEPIIPFRKTEQDVNQAAQAESEDATLLVSADEASTQVAGNAADSDATQVVAEADDTTTQVITDHTAKEQGKKSVKKGKKNRKHDESATQVFDDEATQVVGDDGAPTQVLGDADHTETQRLDAADDDATQVVAANNDIQNTAVVDGDATKVVSAVDNDATQVVSAVDDEATQVISAVDENATQLVTADDDIATQVVSAEDDATQVVTAVTYEDDEATQVVTEEEPSSAASPKEQAKEPEVEEEDGASTQIIGKDANLAPETAGSMTGNKNEDATQMLPQEEDATQMIAVEETQLLNDTGVSKEDATQIFGLGDETLLFNKSGVEDDTSQVVQDECSGEAETQVFDAAAESPTVSTEEATQLFDTAESKKPQRARRSAKKALQEECSAEAETQVLDVAAKASAVSTEKATPLLDTSENKRSQRAKRGKKPSPAKTSPAKKPEKSGDVDATQAYEEGDDAEMSTLYLETSTCSSTDNDLVATQAYTLQGDEDDLAATQAYSIDVDHDAPTQVVDTTEFAVPTAPPKKGRGRPKKKTQPSADHEATLPYDDNQETQAYEALNEGTSDDIDATQAYSLEEDEDDTPAMEKVESSQEEEDTTSIIKIPSMLKKSPAKSALASTDNRGKRRSRVAFVEEQKQEESKAPVSGKSTRGKATLKRQETPAVIEKKQEEKAVPAVRGRRGRSSVTPEDGVGKGAASVRTARTKTEEKTQKAKNRPRPGKSRPHEETIQEQENGLQKDLSPKKGRGHHTKDIDKSLEISLGESPTFSGRQKKMKGREVSSETPLKGESEASSSKRGRGRLRNHEQDTESKGASDKEKQEKETPSRTTKRKLSKITGDTKKEDKTGTPEVVAEAEVKASPVRRGRPRKKDGEKAVNIPSGEPSLKPSEHQKKRTRESTPEPEKTQENQPSPVKRGRGLHKQEIHNEKETKPKLEVASVTQGSSEEDVTSKSNDVKKTTRRGVGKKEEEARAVPPATKQTVSRRSVAATRSKRGASEEPSEIPSDPTDRQGRTRHVEVSHSGSKASAPGARPATGRGRKSVLENSAVSDSNQNKNSSSQSSQTPRGRRRNVTETLVGVTTEVKLKGRRHTDVGTKATDGTSANLPTRTGRRAGQASRAEPSKKANGLPEVAGEVAVRPTRSSQEEQTAKQEDSIDTDHSSEGETFLSLKQNTKGSKGSKPSKSVQKQLDREASESKKGAASSRGARSKGATRGAKSVEDKESQQTHKKEKQSPEPAKEPRGRASKRGAAKNEETAEPEAKKQKASQEASPHKSEQAQPTPTTPSLRHKKPDRCPKVMFTGVVDKLGEKIVKDLGGELVDSIFECTHLVTDKVRRTVKFLCGLARGLLIVHPTWLEKCKAAKQFLDASPFLLEDEESEKKFKFSLAQSLQKVSKGHMLKGYKVHATKNVKPEPQQIKDIVKCAGGQYLASIPKKATNNTVVISCHEDEADCRAVADAGVAIVTAEFLLSGILQQQVDTEQHKLALTSRGRSKRQSTVSQSAADAKKSRR